MYTPTWDEELTMTAKRDGLMSGTYSGVTIVPLLVEAGSANATYTNGIFACTTTDPAEHLQRCKVILWPRTGEPCKTIAHPVVDGKTHPHGSFLDTQACPLWATHPLCLRQYLQVRTQHLHTQHLHTSPTHNTHST